MRFQIWLQEPFDPWCKLQDPANVSVEDCFQCSFCRCDGESCEALYSDEPVYSPTDGWYARFDITLEGATADGSVQGFIPDISASLGGPVERIRLYASDKD